MYNQEIIDKIKEQISSSGHSIAVAESVTSGHIQSALSLAVEAAQYFQGGITCYNLGQKTRHLDIEPILAEQSNCIHKKVAADMALAVCQKFISNYGIGITGYATIVPEIEDEGLFAYVAIAFNGSVVVNEKITSGKEKPVEVQIHYTQQVLEILHKYLLQKDK